MVDIDPTTRTVEGYELVLAYDGTRETEPRREMSFPGMGPTAPYKQMIRPTKETPA